MFLIEKSMDEIKPADSIKIEIEYRDIAIILDNIITFFFFWPERIRPKKQNRRFFNPICCLKLTILIATLKEQSNL